MIWIRDRKMCPDDSREFAIGFAGDNGVKCVMFALPGTAFFAYSFRLDMERENGEKGIAYLTKAVQDERIVLSWVPDAAQMKEGNLKVQVRAFATEGDEVWHSEPGIFYVGGSIEAEAEFPEVYPSEFATIEERIAALDEAMTQKVADMGDLCDAAESNLSDAQTATGAAQYSATVAQEAAQAAQTSAANAQTSATNAMTAREYAAGMGTQVAEKYHEAETIVERTAQTAQKLEQYVEWMDSLQHSPYHIRVEYGMDRKVYDFTKKDQRMSTIFWCDAGDRDHNRRIEFGAEVSCHNPYSDHSWRLQVRTQDNREVNLLLLGSDGRKTKVYAPEGTPLTTIGSGYHEYAVSWSQTTGEYTVFVDGVAYSGQYNPLVMQAAHGVQWNADWTMIGNYVDTMRLYYFRVLGEGEVRAEDGFQSAIAGTAVPAGWYKNDSGSNNTRAIALLENDDVYLVLSDAEGEKRTGNIKGRDASIGDGSVGMSKLSPELQTLLAELSALLPEGGNTA